MSGSVEDDVNEACNALNEYERRCEELNAESLPSE